MEKLATPIRVEGVERIEALDMIESRRATGNAPEKFLALGGSFCWRRNWRTDAGYARDDFLQKLRH